VKTSQATMSTGNPVPGYEKPVQKYHPTVAFSERGEMSLNIRPGAGHSFGDLELGGRFYSAQMINVHAVGLHAIDNVRYDGELHIHHYMFGDYLHKGDMSHDGSGKFMNVIQEDHDSSIYEDGYQGHGGDHGDDHGGDHGGDQHDGHRRLNTSRRLDAFRGDTHIDENVIGGPSFQVITVIPLMVTTNPGGDFMDMLQPHDVTSGEKAYMSHSDITNIIDTSEFYEYRGTLIYPPCSDETTHYIVYTTPLKVSQDQLYTEFPTRSGFDTTPALVNRPNLELNKNFVPMHSLGSGASCSESAGGSWTYADTHCWKTEYPNCGGQKQSPINIISEDALVEDAHEKDNFLSITKYHPVSQLVVKHNGHALQVKDKLNGISHLGLGYVTVDGQFYFLRQFHIHFPSEHVIDGHQHAAELHLVHQAQNHWGSTAFENNDILVTAIMFDIGEKESPLLKQLFLPDMIHFRGVKNGWSRTIETPVDLLRALGPVLKGDYFRYSGSFTTPPCDEVVKWFVFKTPLSISTEQFEAFKAVFPNPANARPVLPMNGRLVNLNSFQAPGETYTPVVADFFLDRERTRNREKPTPYVILGGVIGGIVLTILIMFATFIKQDTSAVSQSAGGLVASDSVGRSRYGRMSDRM